MAADVSSLVRLLARYGREDGGADVGDGEWKHRSDLVTRDLLGGCCVGGGVAPAIGPKKELYPALNEIMFRDVGSQQSRTPAAAGGGGGIFTSGSQIQDLNMPPLWASGVTLPVRRSAVDVPALRQQHIAAALDLKLLRRTASPSPAGYQSVCTLEKVKSALERAERESRWKQQQPRDTPPLPRRAPAAPGSPASSSTTTSSAKRRLERVGPEEEGEGESKSPSGPEATSAVAEDGADAEMAATGCPSCLMYVLISRSNPRCPRCGSAVPLPPPLPPAAPKKARFDLNAATAAAATSPVKTVKFF